MRIIIFSILGLLLVSCATKTHVPDNRKQGYVAIYGFERLAKEVNPAHLFINDEAYGTYLDWVYLGVFSGQNTFYLGKSGKDKLVKIDIKEGATEYLRVESNDCKPNCIWHLVSVSEDTAKSESISVMKSLAPPPTIN